MPSTDPRNIAQDAADAARQLSDRVLQSAEAAVGSTRAYTEDALDQADSRLRRARRRLEPAIDDMAEQAQRMARRGMELAAGTRNRAQDSLQRCAQATGRYVADQPVKAVLIAAVAGAVVAGLALAATRRQRDADRY